MKFMDIFKFKKFNITFLNRNKFNGKILPENTHRIIGYWSDYKWYPKPQFVVPGSFEVSSPSKKYPNTYLRYVYTRKYFKQLLKAKPELVSQIILKIPDYIPQKQYKFYHIAKGKELQKNHLGGYYELQYVKCE